jgi:hypothetical protein
MLRTAVSRAGTWVIEVYLDLFVDFFVPHVDAAGARNVQCFGRHAVDLGGSGGETVDVAARVFELLIDFGDRLLCGNSFGPPTLSNVANISNTQNVNSASGYTNRARSLWI